MKISVLNFNEVIKIEPNIEGNAVYSISVTFNNGEAMCYGYSDRKNFMDDYKRLTKVWKMYCKEL